MNSKESRLAERSTTGTVPKRERDLGRYPKLSALRWKLGEKAKREPGFRFYALYDKVARWDTLQAAWAQVHANDGAAGVDGLTIAAIAARPGGVEGFLRAIQAGLQGRSYRAQAGGGGGISPTDGKPGPAGGTTVQGRGG